MGGLFAIVSRSDSSSCRCHRTASQQCCCPRGKSLSSRIFDDQFSKSSSLSSSLSLKFLTTTLRSAGLRRLSRALTVSSLSAGGPVSQPVDLQKPPAAAQQLGASDIGHSRPGLSGATLKGYALHSALLCSVVDLLRVRPLTVTTI